MAETPRFESSTYMEAKSLIGDNNSPALNEIVLSMPITPETPEESKTRTAVWKLHGNLRSQYFQSQNTSFLDNIDSITLLMRMHDIKPSMAMESLVFLQNNISSPLPEYLNLILQNRLANRQRNGNVSKN